MVGKGDSQRPLDWDVFGANYAQVFKHTCATGRPGKYIMIDGRLRRVTDALKRFCRKRDATNIRSVSAGVSVDDIPLAISKLAAKGVEGVKFDPTNGDAIFANRQARLKALKVMGLHDKQEIRG